MTEPGVSVDPSLDDPTDPLSAPRINRGSRSSRKPDPAYGASYVVAGPRSSYCVNIAAGLIRKRCGMNGSAYCWGFGVGPFASTRLRGHRH